MTFSQTMNKCEFVLAQIYDIFVIEEVELLCFTTNKWPLRAISLIRSAWHAILLWYVYLNACCAILSRILCQKPCFGLIFHSNDLPEVFLEDKVPFFIYLRSRIMLKCNPFFDDLLRSSPVKLAELCSVAFATEESLLVQLWLVCAINTLAYKGVVTAIAIHALEHFLLVRVLCARLLGTHSLFFWCLKFSIYISAESESYK